MKVELLLKNNTGIIPDFELKKLRQLQLLVKNNKPFKGILFTSYEAMNLGSVFAMPFDSIVFKGHTV